MPAAVIVLYLPEARVVVSYIDVFVPLLLVFILLLLCCNDTVFLSGLNAVRVLYSSYLRTVLCSTLILYVTNSE
jgi:hypothetical protein